MFQHQPKQRAVTLVQGAINTLSPTALITLGTTIPSGSIMLLVVQGVGNASSAPSLAILGKGDEISLGTGGPLSADGATAAYIRWIVWRTPSGYIPSNSIFVTTTGTWGATTYATLIYCENSTQYLGFGSAGFNALANGAYQASLNLGAGTIVSNAYRQTTLEFVFNTNAAATAWNGLGNSGITPDAGSWTSIFNGAGTGLGIINLWAAFSQRPPLATAIIGRYATAVTTHHTIIRFGGG